MVKHSDAESECEGAPGGSEARFRVRVNMERLYSDHRARALVCVAPRRRVRWLRRRLRALFQLPRAFHLLSRGHLLPPDEPLALLRPDDPVDVLPDPPAPLPKSSAAGDVVHFADQMAIVEKGFTSSTSLDDVNSPTKNVVESVDRQMATVHEQERSPTPECPDDLTETKRRALLLLEQYCTQPPECASRPRRRRVRRRRRAEQPEPGHSTPVPRKPTELAAVFRPADEPTDEPADEPTDEPAAVFRPADEPASLREPVEPSAVLRAELQPRAPRVVRPLCDQNNACVIVAPSALIDT